MDSIKVAKVPDVVLLRLGKPSKGVIHLTPHHMIFKDSNTGREMWICYPIIVDAERKQYNPLMGHSCIRLRCRDFTFIALNIASETLSQDLFDSIMKLTCVPSIEYLYAFIYKPGVLEKKVNTWNIYDVEKEFVRQGVDNRWRFTNLNKDYTFAPTYPSRFMVPESISDNVLNYAVKFRSKSRLPALSYYHKFNSCTITRCSQPMVGLKQNRSIQDEKLIGAIFSTTAPIGSSPENPVIGACSNNLIVDARPTANAMAQTALGAGTENMENYKDANKVYLGIDNIHVMRDSLNKVVEALKNGDVSMLSPNQELLHKSQWLKHISILLEGSELIARHVHYNFSHVVIHCSDGWDRTSQLSSLAQLFLDPYYRTIDGFIILLEKEWLSFGHRFAERSGILSNEKHFVQINDTNQAQQVFNTVSNKLVKQSHIKYTSPIFHQFIDCVYQVVYQKPELFEFNERFLRRLLYHSYSGQYGTFLYNSEKERVEANASKRTRQVWDYFVTRKQEFTNSNYNASGIEPAEILLPNSKQVRWWPELYGRTDEEMNNQTRNGSRGSSSPDLSQFSRSQNGSPSILSMGLQMVGVGSTEGMVGDGGGVLKTDGDVGEGMTSTGVKMGEGMGSDEDENAGIKDDGKRQGEQISLESREPRETRKDIVRNGTIDDERIGVEIDSTSSKTQESSNLKGTSTLLNAEDPLRAEDRSEPQETTAKLNQASPHFDQTATSLNEPSPRPSNEPTPDRSPSPSSHDNYDPLQGINGSKPVKLFSEMTLDDQPNQRNDRVFGRLSRLKHK